MSAVRITRRFRASPERVFDAFLELSEPAFIQRLRFPAPASAVIRDRVIKRVSLIAIKIRNGHRDDFPISSSVSGRADPATTFEDFFHEFVDA